MVQADRKQEEGTDTKAGEKKKKNRVRRLKERSGEGGLRGLLNGSAGCLMGAMLVGTRVVR